MADEGNLARLKNLRDDELLSEDEFEAKRALLSEQDADPEPKTNRFKGLIAVALIVGGFMYFAVHSTRQTNQSKASIPSSSGDASQANVAAPSSTLDRASAATDADGGMFRWSSGMQMGQFWASVSNTQGDWLRLFSDGDQITDTGWQPTLEIASNQIRKKIDKSGEVNFVIGEKAATFPYAKDNDEDVSVQLFGLDGARNVGLLVQMLRTAHGRPICVEFPSNDYRTCFSTKGAETALASG